MRSVTAADITDFLLPHAHRVTHDVVAHTRYTTYKRTPLEMDRLVEKAKRDCQHFRRCFNKSLYGNKAARRPQMFQPLLIATLEGSLNITDPGLTLHYNFAIGNLPQGLTDAELRQKFRESWVRKAHQRDDIFIENVANDKSRARGWIGYITKEAWKEGNMEVWDFVNTQIPYAAFAAC
jgi:hypothetical protein